VRKLYIGGGGWRDLGILICSGRWGVTCQNVPRPYEMENRLEYGQYKYGFQNGFFIALGGKSIGIWAIQVRIPKRIFHCIAMS